MSTSIQSELAHEYAQYFSVQQAFSVNLKPLSENDKVPDEDDFAAEIPDLFKLASDMLVVDQAQLRDLNMSERSAKLIAQILAQQSSRISMILTYMLRQEDHPEHRQQGLAYSGGGFVTQSTTKLAIGDYVQVKLFLPDDYAAIFAYGQVIEATDAEQPEYTIAFVRLREEDQELLVRASLHSQARQLKQRSAERQQLKSSASDETITKE
ncbi:PilZ domain-containing protein [Pseudidiomarina planktonica]|uniref:PilZ domain-containing protein n=1 Tax=Pseudidiomarina planktonica TaxID=1323738 RepID=A0A1Y6F0F5_9GAMM|nr:PilZ domain-containing protein [Pseudidiomarina planktonica]RUO65155.1 PilZ domain-containing protein [Pseudidiomarina planktonica]SMQ66252.1 PilZ domain-containing protein [Pseudidiomarina planktonica]